MDMIARIRQEIERRYNKHKYSTAITEMVYAEEDEQILSFLSTLESGSSEIPKDLEQASKEYCPDDAYPFGPDIINKEVRKAFIAGYNLCKEQTEKMWLEDRDGCFWDGVNEGKKAMKEQMLKEAVAEVEVGMRGDPIEIILDKYVQRAMGIFPRDKVRIIILKED